MKHTAYRIEEPKRSVGFHGSIDVLTSHLEILRGRQIILVSDRNDFISDLEEWAQANSLTTTKCPGLSNLLEDEDFTTPYALIVDVKPYTDVAPVLDALLEFRMIRPTVAVVLISEEVKRHDFGTDRLRICDVTLKAPVDGAILSLGISEALSNNVKWNEKLYAQRKEILESTDQ